MAPSAGDSLDTDLKVHGFSVVSSAISVAELHSLSTDFESDASPPPRPPRFVSPALRQIIAPKLGAVVENISSPPRARVRGGIYQPAEQTAKVGWHTGSIAFFSFPQYLNVWIPLPSESAPNATISVVDPSVLSRESPELAEIAEQNGSPRLVASGGKVVAYDNFHLRYIELPRLDLDKLAVRLTLNWGDALIMRHDVLHRSHDERGDGLAVSFCVVRADAIM